jgi:hypothetical protein
MRLKPNDLPPMVKDEARNVVFKLGGAVGANSISSFAVESCPSGLTFGTPSTSGTNVTVKVTAAETGSYTIKGTAVLSSAETLIGHVRVVVEECHGTTSDY